MGAFIDLKGKRFGKLTVIDRSDVDKNGNVIWKCKCDCGNTVFVLSGSLRNNITKSCGCWNSESKRKFNEYYTCGNVTFVKDSTRCIYGIIDTEDLTLVSKYCWKVNKDGYFVTKVKGKEIAMHRIIMKCPPDKQVDHIYQVKNGVCDNRKNNLRICTKEENLRNKTVYKNSPLGISGVLKNKNGTFEARFSIKGKDIYLGTFKTLEEAKGARRNAELKYWGDDYVKIK